jgi:hypothetical protein
MWVVGQCMSYCREDWERVLTNLNKLLYESPHPSLLPLEAFNENLLALSLQSIGYTHNPSHLPGGEGLLEVSLKKKYGLDCIDFYL